MLMRRQISRAQISWSWCLLCFIMQMTKDSIRMCGCMGCVGPLLKAYAINKMLLFQVAQSGWPPREKN